VLNKTISSESNRTKQDTHYITCYGELFLQWGEVEATQSPKTILQLSKVVKVVATIRMKYKKFVTTTSTVVVAGFTGLTLCCIVLSIPHLMLYYRYSTPDNAITIICFYLHHNNDSFLLESLFC